jgi:hypothetical protein
VVADLITRWPHAAMPNVCCTAVRRHRARINRSTWLQLVELADADLP